MDKKIFFILEGSNGATYIYNAKNSNTVAYSLRFYKARTLKQKIKKMALKLYLNTLGTLGKVFSLNSLKDKKTIAKYLEALTEQDIDFELNENNSILVSPTRDKIIVHHHDDYFHKFAFGNSYKNVKYEANIYALLDRPLEYFKVSKFYDYLDSDKTFCCFKLSSQAKGVNSGIDLTSALVEMFNITKQDKYLFTSYLGNLKSRYIKSNVEIDSIKRVFENLVNAYRDDLIALGLVHRDFKHWNINDDEGLLIYDFEEAITNGSPLEDMFNYHIDPIISYQPVSNIVSVIFEQKHITEYQSYLVLLGIKLDYKVLLYCYLIERVLFYTNVEHKKIRNKYIELFEFIIKREKLKC